MTDNNQQIDHKLGVYEAFALFQAELGNIEKSKTVKVTAKNGSSYSFKYAPHDAIVEFCRPILAKYKLSVHQSISGGYIYTIISHIGGGIITSSLDFPTYAMMFTGNNPTPQPVGSWITYMRRYSYCMALGIVTEEDEDGNIASGDHVATQNKPKQVPKTNLQIDPCPVCQKERRQQFTKTGKTFAGCETWSACIKKDEKATYWINN